MALRFLTGSTRKIGTLSVYGGLDRALNELARISTAGTPDESGAFF